MHTVPDVTRIRLVGGNLALDFVNTRSGPPAGDPDDDVLAGYPELIAWGVYAGAITAGQAEALRRSSGRDPDAAHAVFARALQLREHLDRIVGVVVAGGRPAAADLELLRDDEAEALAHARLEQSDAFAWTWHDDRTLGAPLRPVVHAAVRLLIEGDPLRVKRCGGCRFVFYDETKNRSRRWCSMEDCGTDEKVRRYVAARRLRATS